MLLIKQMKDALSMVSLITEGAISAQPVYEGLDAP